MVEARPQEIINAIHALADAEGSPLAMRHVCGSCVDLLSVDGAALFLASPDVPAEPALATNSPSGELAETQTTLGEGPAVECLNAQRVVAAHDLSTPASLARWPMFAPAAMAAGVHAATAFPLALGTVPVGALQVHHRQPGRLTSEQRRDGRVVAELALRLLLLCATAEAAPDLRDELLAGDLQARWRQVNQAIGTVSVQLHSGAGEACLRLRATACVQDRRLSDVAADVLAGQLRYDDPDRP